MSCTTPDRAIGYMENAFPAAAFNHAIEKVNFGGEIRSEKVDFVMRKMIEKMRERSGGSKKTGITCENIDILAVTINKSV